MQAELNIEKQHLMKMMKLTMILIKNYWKYKNV